MSERMAFNDGFNEGYAKALDRVRALEADNAALQRQVEGYARALTLLRGSPHIRLEYCKANNLLPDPVTVESSVDEYWRKAIVNQALEGGNNHDKNHDKMSG